MEVVEPTISRTLLPELARAPGHLVWRASARVQLALAEVLPTGVDIHGYAAMLALGKEGTLSQQAVAGRVSISRTTMAKVAIELVGRGLVDRVRHPADRRIQVLHLLPEATEVLDQAKDTAAGLLDVRLQALTELQVGRLVTLLGRFVTTA